MVLNNCCHLPHHPLPPSECPLLCIFYAEFDNIVGPRVCYQSPRGFMHHNVDIEIDDLNGTLEEAFLAVLPVKEKIHQFDLNSDSSRQDPTGIMYYWSWSPKHISNQSPHNEETV